MDLKSYAASGRAQYEALATVVRDILVAAINQTGAFRLQHVQSRAKSVKSVRGKLEKLRVERTRDVRRHVKDLAGCRLVFYTNSDVENFGSSRIIADNFEIDWERTKVHHPVPGRDDSLFMGNNFVVKLKDERIALPEHTRFRGMWCEVQVQTSLNHVWSEMQHDIIYKPPQLKGFGAATMKDISARLEKIMRDYLVPAGHEFQKVVSDYERLQSGKELLDLGALEALTSCEDNNSCYDVLERFLTYVLPHYDDLTSVQREVRAALLHVATQARTHETRAIETPFGQFAGRTVEQVVDLVADGIDRLRYLGTDAVVETFDALVALYSGAHSDGERARIVRSSLDLSKHNLAVWREAGPTVQNLLVDRIRRLDGETLAMVKPMISRMLGEILKSEVSGTSSTYNALTISTGPAVASDALRQVRTQAIGLLMQMFEAAGSDKERRQLMSEIDNATRTPMHGAFSDDLMLMVVDDTKRILITNEAQLVS